METEKSLVYVFSKKEYRDKSSKEILGLIQSKGHPDYMTIYLVKKILEKLDLESIFIDWKDIHNIDFKKTRLLIIPQEMMIGGRLKNFKKFIEGLNKAEKNNCDFIFLHHHPYYLKDFIGIDTIYENGFLKGYFRDTVIDLKINDEEPELIKGIEKILNSSKSYQDEFTYYKSLDTKFKVIIEKVPAVDLATIGIGRQYTLYGYNKSKNDTSIFLIDIHATGSKRGLNGKLFQILFENTLKYIFNKKFSLTLDEEEIIKQINSSSLEATIKKQLIDSRVGQGIFRKKLIDYWGGCSVTGMKRMDILRASHIKPWRLSSNEERLDLFNGLLLLPNLDVAFDQGLITFDKEGRIIISHLLTEADRKLLGINPAMKININEKHLGYLKSHNEIVFEV